MNFISQIQKDQDAYNMFYQQAEKRGMVQASPQRKFQFQYFDQYIKPA